SASADQRAAAGNFLQFLRRPEPQRRFADQGFRDYKGRSSDRLADSVGDVERRRLSLVAPPSGPVLQDILRGWDALRKKADVLLVMDVSGSMAEHTATGESKLSAAEDAALQGLGVLGDDDDVGLWSFSSRSPGQAPYTELLLPSRLGDVRP